MKALIQRKTGLARRDQRLSHATRELEDDLTLLHYGIEGGSCVELLARIAGGGKRVRGAGDEQEKHQRIEKLAVLEMRCVDALKKLPNQSTPFECHLLTMLETMQTHAKNELITRLIKDCGLPTLLKLNEFQFSQRGDTLYKLPELCSMMLESTQFNELHLQMEKIKLWTAAFENVFSYAYAFQFMNMTGSCANLEFKQLIKEELKAKAASTTSATTSAASASLANGEVAFI
jgi:hypothetical protein